MFILSLMCKVGVFGVGIFVVFFVVVFWCGIVVILIGCVFMFVYVLCNE